MVGRRVYFWEGPCSGATLLSGMVESRENRWPPPHLSLPKGRCGRDSTALGIEGTIAIAIHLVRSKERCGFWWVCGVQSQMNIYDGRLTSKCSNYVDILFCTGFMFLKMSVIRQNIILKPQFQTSQNEPSPRNAAY